MAFKYNGNNVNVAQISSSVGYVSEGTPTLQQGILSNIDSTNYITTDTSFDTTFSFSIILKYKLFADGNLTYFIGNTDGFKFYSTSTNANNLGGMIRASSEDEWTYLNVPTISHQADTWYILQFDYNGTDTYTVTVKNESGTVLGTDTTTSNIKIAAGNICFGYNGGSAAEEIDLNNTYIYINNKLWFWQPKEANYVIQNGGQTGYEIVGSPTISNGVVSNFSDSSYFYFNNFPMNSKTSWEINIKATTINNDNQQRLIFFPSGYLRCIGSTPSWNLYIDGQDFWLNGVEDYPYIKIKRDGTNIYGYNSTDGENYTLKGTIENASLTDGILSFGALQYSSLFWAGSIDLKETYIKVDGNYFFNGASKLIWANPHLYLEGPNTYTKVGNVDITDNIASGFSSNNYLAIPQSLAAGYIKTYEIFTKFTAPETFDNSSGLICTNDYNINGIYLNKETSTTATIKVASHSNNSLYTISGNVGQVTPSSTFYVWYIVDGENGTHTLKTSTDGKIYSTWGTSYTTGVYNDNTTLWNIGLGIYGVFNGSIDLNETYIKVNNNLWFYGRNNATQNIAPVPNNYTYGATTTTGIGFVDTRTQKYTELPSGVTLGNDSNIILKRLTINAPSGSTVTINGNNTSNLSLPIDSTYTYTVSQTGYKTLTDTGTLSDNTTIDICSVTASGSNATVNIDSSGYSSVFVVKGSTISFTASKINYKSYSSTKTINTNTTIAIANLTANISPTPDYLEINGEEVKGILFEEGTNTNYSVYAEKDGYNNLYQNGTISTSLEITQMPTLTPLCFIAREANCTIQYSVYLGGSGTGIDMKYSTDLTNWTTLSKDTAITLNNIGDKIYLKGNNQTFNANGSFYRFVITGSVDANGNLTSILDDGDGTTITNINDYCFSYLFINCTALINPPLLPLTTVGTNSCQSMFEGCSNLIRMPKLPATTLANYCYYFMFKNCTNLEKLNILPSTTLAQNCYYYMFNGCTAIINTPINMLPATSLTRACYNYMFSNCTSLVNPPNLPATNLEYNCYGNMFKNCASLIKAPELSATTLASSCYDSIFNGCSSLNEIRLDYTGSFNSTYFNNWVTNVSSTGTLYYNGTDTRVAVWAIPTGWTVSNF